jgi:protein-disulfide isomerase
VKKQETGTNIANRKPDNIVEEEDYTCPTCGVKQCDPDCDNNINPSEEKEIND